MSTLNLRALCVFSLIALGFSFRYSDTTVNKITQAAPGRMQLALLYGQWLGVCTWVIFEGLYLSL